MILLVVAFAADAAPIDLTHPEFLAAQSAQQLVDLSAIESATMTVWFDGDFAPNVILGNPGAKALREYVAKTTPGADKDEALTKAEAMRLAATVRFDVEVQNDASKGVTIVVPSVHWGELESFEGRPDDDEACNNIRTPLEPLLTWSKLHVSGSAWSSPTQPILRAVEGPNGISVSVEEPTYGTQVYELERETLLPVSYKLSDQVTSLRYVDSSERNLLGHIDKVTGSMVIVQNYFTFAEVSGVPWPRDIIWREVGRILPTMHFGDVVLKDDVAPFLADRGTTPAIAPPPAAAPIDQTHPRSWPDALDAIDALFYSWAPAESLHFTITRVSDPTTWFGDGELQEYIKARPGPPPKPLWMEVARLANQVTYDVDVVLQPYDLRVTAVHLGELEGAFDATLVEALRQRVEKNVFGSVFGTPNHMMVYSGGFFPRTEVVTRVERETGGPVITTARAPQADASAGILLDDETGLPVQARRPTGAVTIYGFDPGPSGKMLLTTYHHVAPDGHVDLSITYTYSEVGGVTVPMSAEMTDATIIFSNWRVVDNDAPFLAKSTATAVTP